MLSATEPTSSPSAGDHCPACDATLTGPPTAHTRDSGRAGWRSSKIPHTVANRYDGRKSGYRRKEAFGARQSGSSSTVCYDALTAERSAAKRARRPRARKLPTHDTLHQEVQTRLQSRHSHRQIARRLRHDFPDDPEMWVSHEAIYQSIYVQGRGSLRRELHQCLRTGRAVRRPQHQPNTRRGRIPDMVNISHTTP